jgi:hypothetical protein
VGRQEDELLASAVGSRAFLIFKIYIYDQNTLWNKPMDAPLPAIVVVHPEVVFDFAINRVIGVLNGKSDTKYASVCREGPLRWTIMGTLHCEYIEIVLHPACRYFEVTSVFPLRKRVKKSLAKGTFEKNIYTAMCKLFH